MDDTTINQDNNKVKTPRVDRSVFYDELTMNTYPDTGGYIHIDFDRSLHIYTRRINQNGKGITAELDILYPDNNPLKSNILLNLQDTKARKNLALELAGDSPDAVPWDKVLDYVSNATIKNLRSITEPLDLNAEPDSLSIEYAIQDLLPRNLPTTIYSPGGKGKSVFALLLANIYEYGLATHLPFLPRQGHVLYLDWESSIEVERIYSKAIRAGLNIIDHREIAYISCTHPLTAIIDNVRTLVKDNDIELVIIDSQMAATAGGPQLTSEAEKASEYYNCLNSLKCTTLTLDHVTKEGMKNLDAAGASSPYGSVVKYNRARSIYELRMQQEVESDHLEFALIHQKFNLGRKQKPLGIAIDFENVGGELRKIEFSQCELADNPELLKVLPNKDIIFNLLLSTGSLTIDDISKETGIPYDTAKTTVNRNKNIFTKIGDQWGVLDRNSKDRNSIP